jgi:nitrogen-specific signal transduction histidine kinase/FixJ family two-component response regulator
VNSPLHILYLEDDPKDAELVQVMLETGGVSCHVTRVETQVDFCASLERDGFDIILADYTLPSFDGISALKIAAEKRPEVPFIFVSGTLGEEVAIEALNIGATDYVLKTRLSRLVPSVVRALREAAERAERQRAEESLRKSETYLAEAQRLSGTGSFGWNVSSGEIFWSEETFRIFEFDRATTPSVELVMCERVHPEDVTGFRQVVERAAHAGQDYTHKYRLRMPDGRVKYLHVVAHAVRNETGDIDFVGSVMDVTAIRLAEVELHKTKTELAHVMRVTSLCELTVSIAQEVNQPLGAVITNAQACLRWLDREPPNFNEAHAALERIVRNGNRAGEVIRRMRTLAKKADTQMIPLNVNDVVSEAMAFLQYELVGYQVSLRMELAPALPVILADRVQLQQVILNLTLNGIEAMQPITDRPRELVIRSEQDEAQQVRVTVTDCGVGFPVQDTDRLFNVLYTTKPNGMGLGLSICRSIIEAHGGHIWAAPNVPRGATIQFTLPLYENC